MPAEVLIPIIFQRVPILLTYGLLVAAAPVAPVLLGSQPSLVALVGLVLRATFDSLSAASRLLQSTLARVERMPEQRVPLERPEPPVPLSLMASNFAPRQAVVVQALFPLFHRAVVEAVRALPMDRVRPR